MTTLQHLGFSPVAGSREIDGSVLMERSVGRFGRLLAALPHLAQLVSLYGYAIDIHEPTEEKLSNIINKLTS